MTPEKLKAAEDWVKANPRDPMVQNVQARIWIEKNPDDPLVPQMEARLSKANSTPPDAPPPPAAPQPNAFNVANAQQAAQTSQLDHIKTLINKPYAEGGMALNGDDINQMAATAILPGMAAEVPNALGAAGRIGIGAMTGAAQGAVNSPTDRVGGAAAGGIAGGVLGSSLEALQGLLGGIKGAVGNLSMAKDLSTGSPELQQQARGMMMQAADKLAPAADSAPSQALNELPSSSPVSGMKYDPFAKSSFKGSAMASALQKSQVPINVAQYMGKNPEVDAILQAEMAKASPDGHQVAGLNVSGDTLNTIQQKLAQTGTADPSAKALSGLGDDDTLRQASFLNRRAQSSPVSTLSNDNFDNRATLKDISNKSGVDLSGYASQLASAAKTANSPIKQGLYQTAKQGVKGMGKAVSGPAGAVNDPRTLSAILSLLTNK